MAPFFSNGTCDPFHPVAQPCTLGNFVRYSVNVSKPEHIAQTLQFVKTHNIRLIICNTGHDFNAKSTGPGGEGGWPFGRITSNASRYMKTSQLQAQGMSDPR